MADKYELGKFYTINGEYYQCVESEGCESSETKEKCSFYGDNCRPYSCAAIDREDCKNVCFIKVNKIETMEKNQDIIEVNGKGYKFIADNNLLESCRKCALRKKYTLCGNKFPCIPSTRLDHKNGHFVELTPEEIADEIVDNAMKDVKNQIERNMKTSKLKPFDIELAKQGKQVCTRDGKEVRIVCFDRLDAKPILALIKSNDGKGETVFDYFENGKRVATSLESDLDLMMIPERTEGWVNIYKYKNGYSEFNVDGIVFETEQEAVDFALVANKNYFKTIKINW